VKTQERRICPRCGNEFSGALEFCPVCMLKGASDERSFSEEAGSTLELKVGQYEHYEVFKGEDGRPIELGRGAMGITYKAFDLDLRCPVTLKVISERYLGDESARLRFLREARAAASVRHANVASVFHLGRTAEGYFYAMEFAEGETLENLIKRSGRLDPKLALEIAAQVASGLAAVHKKGLVHRDIKPSNIMVSLEEEGRLTVKIIDLGLAKGKRIAVRSGDFNAWGFRRDSRVRQSRTICRSWRGHSIRSLLAWGDALEDGDRPGAIPRFSC
jgi:Protein kinase domain